LPKLLILIILTAGLWANGTLNVFTGDKDAEIFINGQLIAKEQVLQHSLPAGTHYIQIKKNNTVVRSRTVEVQDNKTETVVLDDFVDFRTNAASRGAIEVEAMRVREARGNIGLGLFGGSPASGLSLKWWPFERVGFQAIGYINNFDDNRDTRLGGRILLALNESVYMNGTHTLFLALGAGRSTLANGVDENKNVIYDLQELSVGIEYKVLDFFGKSESTNYLILAQSKDRDVDFLMWLLFVISDGLLRLGHIDLELGVEHTGAYYPAADKTTDRTAVKFSGGYHIYF